MRARRAGVGRRAERRQGVGRVRPEGGAGARQALLARADVVLEGFRPGVAARLGVGPDDAPSSAVYCSITGFGTDGPHAARAGHDLNYLGWAGVLEDTAPGLPPAAAGRPRGRSARRRDGDPGGAARAGAHRARRAADDLDDARLAPPRLAPARRRPAAAVPHGRARLLPDLRDRRRPPADGRRARAEVLRPDLRADRAAGAGGAPARRRRRRRSSRPSSRPSSHSGRSPPGSSSSTARTSASAPSRHSPRPRRSSATEPACRPPAVGQHTAAWRAELDSS